MGQTSLGEQGVSLSAVSSARYTAAVLASAIFLMVILRVYALDSDAFSHLSWSSALLTDEGFYTHNARNVVLFGQARTDQFNNMLIMPLLHRVQVWVFSTWGMGAVQARSISVVAGLLTLPVFYLTIRKCFGKHVALVGLLFLGLGHANLMYSRMALMDAPGALGLVCVFAAWVYGVSLIAGKPGNRAVLAWPWFAVCGVLLVVTWVTRGMVIWLAPVPAALLLYAAGTDRANRAVWLKGLAAFAGASALCLAVYLYIWYLPNKTELSQMNHYYFSHQLMPHGLFALRSNVTHALFGDSRGVSPYLFRHSPVEFALALALLTVWLLPKGVVHDAKPTSDRAGSRPGRVFDPDADPNQIVSIRRMAGSFLGAWLIMAWITYAVISYSPDRYYVLFYPALAALAAYAVCNAEQLRNRLQGSIAFAAIITFLAYHALESVLHHSADWLLYSTVVVVAALFWPRVLTYNMVSFWRMIFHPALLLGCWFIINASWSIDWLAHLTYVRRDADRWLAQNLPVNSVLIGDVAPGLCMDNLFTAVSVIPGLCNFEAPLESFAGRPRYVAILDERFLEKYWLKTYPLAVADDLRIRHFPSIVKFPVGIYRVDDSVFPLPVRHERSGEGGLPAAPRVPMPARR